MKNFAKIFGIIILIMIIGFSMAACDGESDSNGNGDDDSVTLPASKGTNDVLGKTLWLYESSKIVFAATGTKYQKYLNEEDEDDPKWEPDGEGSYSYNSDNKTITLAAEYLVYKSPDRKKTKCNKSQYKTLEGKQIDAETEYWRKKYGEKALNAMMKESGFNSISEYKATAFSRVDEMFSPQTYDYQLTTDGSLLVQKKLPANKGTNELTGKTFDYNDDLEYTFTATGYSVYDYYDDEIINTGTYAYDSSNADKRVWLRPEKVYSDSEGKLLTILEYYNKEASGSKDEKAAYTNSRFRMEGAVGYGLNPNWIGDDPSHNYSSDDE